MIRRYVIWAAIAVLCAPAMTTKAAYSPTPGDLVKATGAAIYYVIDGNKRMPFPNEATYFSWYSDFNAVKIISDSELAAMTLASLVTMRPGLRIVKFDSSPKVYAVAHGGTLRWLTTEDIASMIFGVDWNNKIIVIPDAFMAAYKFSTDITAGGQYWWAKERDASPTLIDDMDPAKSPDAVIPVTPPVADPVEPVTPPVTPAQTPVVSPVVNKNILYVLFDPGRPDSGAFIKSSFERVVYGATPSVADYYRVQSNGNLNIVNAGILGWYSADKAATHYWSNDENVHLGDGFKTGEVERVFEAMEKADADFDFKKYDINGDGTVSVDELAIFVVIPQFGDPTARLATLYSAEDPKTVSFKADDVIINQVEELGLSAPLGEKAQFGTIAHSIATYILGLSDNTSAGQFSLVGSEPHLDQSFDPYTRINLGWITPKIIANVNEISTQTLTSAIADHPVIRINRDQPNGVGAGTQYFLIENRQRDIYDDSLPDTGLAVWEVNGATATLVHLDTTANTDATALWHKGSTDSYTARELHWSDGVRSGVRLLNLGYSDPVMSFVLEKKILTEQDLMALPSPIR